VTPLAVTNFLKTWLTGHITQTDKAYSAFLVGKGVK
jgi:hemerythrin